jgi:adenylate cyclase
MLQLRFTTDGEERTLLLDRPEVSFGRSGDNEVLLPDYSVSRRHAVVRQEGDRWIVVDLQSTNGIQLNQVSVEQGEIRPGDLLKIGVFEIRVEAADGATPPTTPVRSRSPAPSDTLGSPGTVPVPRSEEPGLGTAGLGTAVPRTDVAPPPPPKEVADPAISNATIIRSLSDISADLGLYGEHRGSDTGQIRQSKREALDQAYSSQVFGFLTKLARMLITTDSDDEILEHVMEIAFEVLPVDRGFILLRDEKSGELECELVRANDQVEFRPQSEVPISKTMLEQVIRHRVALMTYDALSDQRLAGTESVRIHQIRAAMCAPLWSGEKIIGVMQLDTPHHTGSFTEPDVDLLATLANYCAVAIERNRHAREAELQRGIRSRLERYHSPAVIEQALHQDPAADEGIRSLKKAEVTVLFADIVGFTAFAEKARPETMAELMEGYFTHAVEAIFDEGGTLDKFIGDCVMAFFGAPMPQPDHALRAVRAAVRIREALDDWNAERRSRGLPEIAVRIGINSGPVVVGDIGSNRRVDYTVLGNTVNVASRIEEGVARPGDIVVGDDTHRQLGGEIPTQPLGEVQLKGLSRKISVHRVVRGGQGR